MFDRLQTAIGGLNLVQDRVQQAVTTTQQGSMEGGRLLEDITLSAGGTTIPHGLGRRAKGAIVVKSDAVESFSVTDGTPPEQFIVITPSGACVVSVWVF